MLDKTTNKNTSLLISNKDYYHGEIFAFNLLHFDSKNTPITKGRWLYETLDVEEVIQEE